MDKEPWYIKFLDKLGINTTKLRWRLYQGEQKAKGMTHGSKVPTGLQWMSYRHKLCKYCGAVNDRDARICDSCSEPLPSMLGYRISRFFRTAAPTDSPITTKVFIFLIALMFAVQVVRDGFSMASIWQPSPYTMEDLGLFIPDYFYKAKHYWRALAFGLLHGGLIHIGFNSYFLVQLGPLVERQIGRVKMLVLITVGQIGAAAACFFWYYVIRDDYRTSVLGASGWLFALLGFGITFAHYQGQHSLRDVFLKNTAFILVLGFIIPGISNTAHIGGLLAGMGMGFLPMGQTIRSSGKEEFSAWNLVAGVCAVLWLITLFYMARSAYVHWK
jgi:rhomboid protease GluP